MDSYSNEGFQVKMRFKQQFDKWLGEFYDESKKPRSGKGITYGRAQRGFQSFMMSPDEVHLDYVDNRMSKGAETRSIMGGLGGRVQKLTQGSTSPYAPTPTDQMHHLNTLSSYAPALKQSPKVLQEFLDISAKEGVVYGEGAGNLGGQALDARAHTGGRGKKGTMHNPTAAGVGQEGVSSLSAHPRGTMDADVKLPDKVYSSGQEMFDAAAPIRAQHAQDTLIGKAADQTRRDAANKLLQDSGILPKGTDVFAPDADLKDIDAAKKFFSESDEYLTKVAEAFDPSLAKAVKGVGSFRSVLALLPFVGQAAGAADVVERTKKATETGNKTDALQASLAAAGMTPGVGIAADVANLVIDAYRFKGSHNRIRGRSGAQKALQRR